jgi:hypothetical protein
MAPPHCQGQSCSRHSTTVGTHIEINSGSETTGLLTGEKTSICVYTTAFVSFIVNQSLWRQKTICLVTIVTVGRCLEYQRRQRFSQNTDCHIFVYLHMTAKPHNAANFILHYINSTRSRKLNDACLQFTTGCDAHFLLSQKLS